MTRAVRRRRTRFRCRSSTLVEVTRGPAETPALAVSGHTGRMAFLLGLVLAASGLHGVATRGPTQPVCQVGTPCSGPAVGTVLVFSHSGRVAARVRTGAGGRYSVRLPAGFYAVRVSPAQKIGGRGPPPGGVAPGPAGRARFF